MKPTRFPAPAAGVSERMAGTFDLDVALLGTNPKQLNDPLNYKVHGEMEEIAKEHPHRYIIVSTQSSGDKAALEWGLGLSARHIGFVGSKRKIAHLREKLIDSGAKPSAVAHIQSPTGIDIGAVTPQEIALSILADIIRIRRYKINNRKSTS